MGYRTLGGRYELVEQLGHGGMGTVHRAVDNRLRRTVAVKVLSEGLAHYSEARARFQREAHAVAALNHPAVATIHDVGEEPGPEGPRPFLVMEYVRGHTLAEALRAGPLPVAQAVAVGCEVLDALHHSHQHGIVHRDIKPSNIMRTDRVGGTGRSGPMTVKVLDFGIAKALTEAATRLTGSGAVPGTPAYLSPEQITGTEVDHRADLYAMGCLLYELLTGRVPFPADSPFAVMHDHLFTEPEPVTAHRPQIPPAVAAVVMRALAKDPADRFADADRMRLALQAALAVTAERTTRLAPPTARRRLLTAAATRIRRAWPPSTGTLLALAGCLLSLLSARGHLIDTRHFPLVAAVAAVAGLLLLPVSAKLSCALAWGPVAETFAVNSELRRAYDGWQRSFVAFAALLLATAAVCAFTALRDRGPGAPTVIVFWLTAAPGVWYFLDDLHKLYVFYALLAAVTFAAALQEALLRLFRHRRHTRVLRAGALPRPIHGGSQPAVRG